MGGLALAMCRQFYHYFSFIDAEMWKGAKGGVSGTGLHTAKYAFKEIIGGTTLHREALIQVMMNIQ